MRRQDQASGIVVTITQIRQTAMLKLIVSIPRATSPPRTPEQYDADAAEAIGMIKEMHTYAPSLLPPVLVLLRSIMKGEEK